jgi:hypothetical protein
MKKTNKNKQVTPVPTVEVTPAVEVTPIREVSIPLIATPIITPQGTQYEIGVPNATRRVTASEDKIVSYRVVPNQRKSVNCKYYVQGGYSVRSVNDPLRSQFVVAVEIPYVDLRAAQLRARELNEGLQRERGVA